MASRRNAPASAQSNRQNEYFVPRDGIDREVITADICRYLGNDALVRPGTYQDDNGRTIQGYYITAYRNLTTAMIADLKNDSARWDQERRKHQSGAVRYTDSAIYEMGARPSANQPQQGYDASGYGNDVKYPGNDTPGYSASNMQNPAAYGQTQGQAWQAAYSGYGGQTPQYSQADMRYAQPSMAGMSQMPMGTGAYAAHMGQEVYAGVPETGVPYGVVRRTPTHQQAAHTQQYSMDTTMADAPMQPPPPPTSQQQYMAASSRQQPAYGYDKSQGAYYAAPARATAQPVDGFLGRQPATGAASAAAAGGGSPRAYDGAEAYDGTTHTPTTRTATAASGTQQVQVPTSSSATTGRTQRERTSERDHDRAERGDRGERHRERDRGDRDRDQEDPSVARSSRKHRDRYR